MEPAGSSPQVFRFALFELDVARNTLSRRGFRVKIQDQPFRVLALLVERRGEIVSRDELRQKLWREGTHVDFDGSLNVILKKLRAAIDDNSDNPRFIETVPRRGYRFIAAVSADYPQPQPASPGKIAPPAPPVLPGAIALSPARRRPLHVTFTAWVLVLLMLAGAGWLIWHRRQKTAAARSTASPVPPPLRSRKSVAVLGFQNISGNLQDAWLATAFSEMLSTELAGGEKLRLVSGEDVANLSLSSPWPRTGTLNRNTASRIGTALNTDLLILGTYATIGRPDRAQVRLDTRLQDAKSGEILAEIAETGSAQDLFIMISRIGGKLRDQIGVPRLEAPDEAMVLASLPSNPEASRFYSLGLIKFREFDYVLARGLFEEAIKADPKFPLAYSMLSRTDQFLGHDDQAKAEAKHGLDLAVGLSRTQRKEIEASYCYANGDRAKAADIYRGLFDLFPDSLDYGLQLAKLQQESYRSDKALGTIQQLRRLPVPARDDPLIDMREASLFLQHDLQTADRLTRSAAAKAAAQGKRLIFAAAQKNLCYINLQHLQNPPECQVAYDIFLAAGNRKEAGGCLQLMAEANRLTGHNSEAIPLYDKAMRMFREAGNRQEIGVTLNNISLVLENEGKWSRAEENYRKARQNFEAVNDRKNTAIAMSNIAEILVWRGRLHEAAEMYRKSWELHYFSGHVRSEFPHIAYASLLLMQGQIQPARLEVEPQIASLRAYGGDPWNLAAGLSLLGDIDRAEGNLVGARRHYAEAKEILNKANAPIANPQVALAELVMAEGHPEKAEILIREAIAEFDKNKSAGDELGGYTSLARSLLAQGKLTGAREAIEYAFQLADLHEFPVRKLPLQLLRAQVMAAAANSGVASARREMLAVIRKCHQLGLYNTECEARLAFGALELRRDPASGRAQLIHLANETRSRGLALLARQAEQAIAAADMLALAGDEPAPVIR